MATEKQRREAERRHRQRQLRRRQELAARRRRINLIVTVVAVLVVVGVVIGLLVATSGDDSTPASGADVSCTWPASGTASRKVERPPERAPAKGTVTVSVRTSRGSLAFALNRANAPCAVASFVSLVQQKYFDGTPCHRLTATATLHVLQCGDPSGTGKGGPGYRFADELTGGEKYTRGVVAMANAGADTNGSQFFVVYRTSQLPASYDVLGTVTSGLDVVTRLAAGGIAGGGQDGRPKQPFSLTRVSVAR